MGQKVSPHGLRVGVIKDWDSKWYANKKDYADLLIEDFNIRKHIKKAYYTAGISRIYIDRAANSRVHVNIFTAARYVSWSWWREHQNLKRPITKDDW